MKTEKDVIKAWTKNEITIHDITYEYVINLTKFFLLDYAKGEINLHKVVARVKSVEPGLIRFDFTFDESIWPPLEPELYENLIEFRAQLRGTPEGSYLPFRLFVKKGYNQDPILLIPGTYLWSSSKESDNDKLSKKDCVIVLYNGDGYFSIDIDKDYGDYIGKFDGEFMFQNELDLLDIKLESDEYIYYGDMDINQLKNELINRGFKVEIR